MSDASAPGRVDFSDSDAPTGLPGQASKGDASLALLRRVQLCTDAGNGRILRFSGVSARVFEDFCRKFDGLGRVTYFGAESGILLVKVAAESHEAGLMAVGWSLDEQLDEMGLKREVFRNGSPRFQSIYANSAAKDSDDGLAPFKDRSGGGMFPTVIIEFGNTQTLDNLREAGN